MANVRHPQTCLRSVIPRNETQLDFQSQGFRSYNRSRPVPATLRRWLPYLTQHQALHVVRSARPGDWRLESSTGPRGPLHLIDRCGWDVGRLRARLLSGEARRMVEGVPFIKVMGNERGRLGQAALDALAGLGPAA